MGRECNVGDAGRERDAKRKLEDMPDGEMAILHWKSRLIVNGKVCGVLR